MSAKRRFLTIFLLATSLYGQTITVGGGAPSPGVQLAFQQAFFQNGFNNLVSSTPDINVTKYGSTGYYQQFSSVSNSATKLALVISSPTAIAVDGSVFQVLDPMYSYYSSILVTVAGYPTINTASCPGIASCEYQLFSNNYALFYYSSGNPNGTGFTTSGTVYTAWNALGGPASSLGMAYAAPSTVTSISKVTATAQQFTGGLVTAITSGVNSGNAFSVVEPIWDVYKGIGGTASALGLPTSNDLTLADGSHRQTFEYGRIVYTAGTAPTIVLPVSQISTFPTGTANLAYGQTLTVTANVYDTSGTAVPNRVVNWTTSNSAIVSLTANGYTATLKGTGSGTAKITATSEGVVSAALVVSAVEACCQIGQGAPTSAIQSAFQAAVTRNNLAIQIPVSTPVRSAGSGYVQDLYSTDGTIHYLDAESSLSQLAHIVTGAILSAYNALSGPTGPFGYPSSDVTAGGTQIFAGGALAGGPVQSVTGPILTKWASLNYETGILGTPQSTQAPFTSISGYSGYSQTFAAGNIFGISSGAYSGQGFYSSGAILTRYLALNGPAGEMGIPISDPSVASGVTRQNFENGYIDLQPGASVAVEHLAARTPTLTITPTTVLPGTKVHFSLAGFNNNASLKVAQTGQSNFNVTVPAGSYAWDTYISSNAANGAITVTATDSASSSSTASATYTIRSVALAKPQVNKTQGDNQSGPPGTVLSTPLGITVTDSSGNAIPNVPVTFSASPGAAVSPASSVTDSGGRATAFLRLPASPGIAAVTAQALGQIAIFNAQVAGSFFLANYPQLQATTQAGTEVAALASMLRFYQNGSAMPAANGLATPAALDQFLQTLPDGYLNSLQLVNLWRLVNFTGGLVSVSPELTDLNTIRTLTAGGNPVMLSLALTQDGSPAGGTSLVSTGIAADGSVVIFDPNPAFARTNLNDYLNSFPSGGHTYQATILSALRLLPVAPSPTGFVFQSISQPVTAQPALNIQSAAGSCSAPITFQDAAANGFSSQFVYCDGTQAAYQATIGLSASYQASLLDLSMAPSAAATQNLSGSSVTTYQIARSSGQLAITKPAPSFTAASILNAASFLPGLSPGGIFSLFGTGLAGSNASSTLTVGGQAAKILLATPFQINAQLPATLAAGNSTLQLTSPFGSLSQSIALLAASPGIFTIGAASDGVSSLGAVVNQTGTINGPTTPALRGSTITIYCTGLGATTTKNGLSVTNNTVTAFLSGAPLPVAFAGLTPGFPGLYQVNLSIPATMAPGLLLPLALNEAGVPSNTVVIALQ